jgi:hypothetical protein
MSQELNDWESEAARPLGGVEGGHGRRTKRGIASD